MKLVGNSSSGKEVTVVSQHRNIIRVVDPNKKVHDMSNITVDKPKKSNKKVFSPKKKDIFMTP